MSQRPDNKNTQTAWPLEIRLISQEKRLEIDFDNQKTFSYPAEFLRVESPSVDVRGYTPQTKKIVSGCRHIGISDVQAVGNYAIRIQFTDNHNTGIYSFTYLYHLGEKQEQIWNTYLEKLKERGLTRDRVEKPL